jgi:hypothetical protein
VGGVVTSTFLVTLFAPLFFVLIEKGLSKRRLANVTTGTAPTSSGNE